MAPSNMEGAAEGQQAVAEADELSVKQTGKGNPIQQAQGKLWAPHLATASCHFGLVRRKLV